VVKAERIRRQQLLRQAEGYFELCMACEDLGALTWESRDRLVDRGLICLDEIGDPNAFRLPALRLRGQLLRIAERYGEAVEALQEASELAPDDLSLYIALGWCYKRMDRLDLAIESLERATDFEDPTGIVRYNLACYWALAGHVKPAITHLTQAFESQPSLRDRVAAESDFDPIREHPDFQAIMSVNV